MIRHYKLKGIGLGTMEGLEVQKRLEGYIKKHRRILGSEIMAETAETYKLFDVVVLLAHQFPKPDANGARRGQLVISQGELAEAARMSSKTVARGLERLKVLGMVEVKAARGKCSVITVVNYGKYQSKKDEDIGQNVLCSEAEKMPSIGQIVHTQRTNCPYPTDKLSNTFQETPSSYAQKTALENIENIENIAINPDVFIAGATNESEIVLSEDYLVEVEEKPKPKKPRAKKAKVEKKLYGHNVRLSDKEHAELLALLGEELLDHYIKRVNGWYYERKKPKADFIIIGEWAEKDRAKGINPLLDGTLKKQPYMTEAQKKNEILKQMWLEADAEEKAAKAKTEKQGDMVIDAKMEVVSR